MLTVLSVGYPLAPVAADPAGGAEQVLAQLDRALVAAGHRSIVVAPEGSSVAGELVAVPAVPASITDPHRDAAQAATRAAIAHVLATERVDIVHLHGLDFASYLPADGPPVLVTLHMPVDWYPAGALRPTRAGVHLVPVSDNQAARAPAGLALLAPITNGVDSATYAPSATKRDFALVIGRVAPEKGFHDAVAAARLADVPLVAAGRLFPYPAYYSYFAERLRPEFDVQRRFVGPVEGEAKRRLLARARCVLIPSTAPETSSLVAMEALASGTPVIAYRAGALPGIVEDGVTRLSRRRRRGHGGGVAGSGQDQPCGLPRRRACPL
ncbi:MAG TPA: glycosyltransferase [Nannocystis sp.]